MGLFNAYRQNKRAGFVLFILFLLFWGCIARLFWLQIVEGQEMSLRAAENKNIMRELQSPRGSIFDRDGRELAVSLISLSLYVDPAGMDDSRILKHGAVQRDPRKLAASLLAEPLRKSEQELYGAFTSDSRFVWLERTMDKDRTDRIEKIIADNKLNGFGFIKESKRYYPMGKLAAQILGFVGTDDRGLSGLELYFDSMLKSAVEPQLIETDMAGRPIFSSVLENNKAKKMAAVYLTIDNRIQFVAEKALDRAMSDTGAKSAAAIVLDVKSGEVLAMVSRPTFDPNYFYNYQPADWSNRAVSTIYEPGSTFKPVVAAAAVNEGVIQPYSLLNDFGRIKVDDREIKNSEGKAYGSVSFLTVITKSLNTGMVEVGLAMGPERINQYLKAFGFGSYTGIELPGEEEGILFKTKEMRQIDLASTSIGQGIAVTPLQLVRAIGAIANGGNLLHPYIVEKVMHSDGTVVNTGGKDKPQRVISEDTSKKILDMMENVVKEGGGAPAAIPGYRVAGKTGTAEKLKEGGGYATGEYIASFIGVAPVEAPRFVVLVLVDTPEHVYYGSQVAAPVFKEIMQQALVIKGIEPSSALALPVVGPGSGQTAPVKNEKDKTASARLSSGQTAVPDLKGYTMRVCAKLLQQNSLSLTPEGSGRAVRQQPSAGSPVKVGSEVMVWFE